MRRGVSQWTRLGAAAALVIAGAAALAGCAPKSYSPAEAASLYESQYGAENVACKKKPRDPASVFRCHAHRTGRPGAGMKIRIDGSGGVVVESCSAIHYLAHPPPGYAPPCVGIGVPYDGLERPIGPASPPVRKTHVRKG
jgi:hypothetical protein